MGRFKRIFLYIVAAALIWDGSELVFAQRPEEPGDMITIARNAYPLTLREATELALLNNFDIQLAKYDTYMARTGEGVAESIYDTIIEAEVKYRNNKAAQATTFAGTQSIDNDYNFGVSKKLPTGTTLSFDVTQNRNWTNSAFATLNPSHDAAYGITIEQDLGKNFFGIQDRGDVKISRIDIENAEFTSLARIEASIADVQRAYWDLVLQAERVAIEKDMLDQAKQLFDVNQEKIQHGVIEAPDLYASEANYKERVNELLLSENTLRTKANVLKLLLNISDEQPMILPSEAFQLSYPARQLDAALKFAFANRYDYQESRKIIEAKDISLVMKKNSIWPQINLELSLNRNGVSREYTEAYQNILDEDNPDFFAGLTVNFPLENTKAKSELKAAELDKARALVALKFLERKITIEIVDQVRLCNVLQELAVNAQDVAQLQIQKLQAERKRFNQGRSDVDTIIRFQEDALRARAVASESKFRYHVALVNLRQKEATLLNEYWDDEL